MKKEQKKSRRRTKGRLVSFRRIDVTWINVFWVNQSHPKLFLVVA